MTFLGSLENKSKKCLLCQCVCVFTAFSRPMINFGTPF